jgi:smad nuclear-interacting protein 1
MNEGNRRRERDDLRERPYGRNERETRDSGRYGEQDRFSDRQANGKDRRDSDKSEEPPAVPIKPNFKVSGALSAAARTTETGVVLKYAAPEEARIPTLKWRLFPFKGEEALDPIVIHEKSFYLFGRDREVCDVPLDHLSCSSQHAVIVHRQVGHKDKLTGLKSFVVKPYIIDLGSRNGTFLNSVRLDDSRYYELFEKDALKFGASSREYIILNEKSR